MCSCRSYWDRYWSSTSGAGGFENNAWLVGGGTLVGDPKYAKFGVRAVRGGF
jgi:hypothetical protein